VPQLDPVWRLREREQVRLFLHAPKYHRSADARHCGMRNTVLLDRTFRFERPLRRCGG
jgi:hypothetical protein